MIRLSVVTILILLTGCASQMTYDGVVYIVNPCPVSITITAKNYTGSVISQDGLEPEVLSLLPEKRGVIAIFSLASLQQDFSGHFSNGEKKFTLNISDGHGEKVLRGNEIYNLLNDVTTNRNLETRNVVYEINDSLLCP